MSFPFLAASSDGSSSSRYIHEWMRKKTQQESFTTLKSRRARRIAKTRRYLSSFTWSTHSVRGQFVVHSFKLLLQWEWNGKVADYCSPEWNFIHSVPATTTIDDVCAFLAKKVSLFSRLSELDTRNLSFKQSYSVSFSHISVIIGWTAKRSSSGHDWHRNDLLICCAVKHETLSK